MTPWDPLGRRRSAAVLVGVLVASGLAGCLDTTNEYYAFKPEEQYENPGVFPGLYQGAGPNGTFVLVPKIMEPLDLEVVRLVSARPAEVMPGGSDGGDNRVYISMAVWKPDVNKVGPVPVIVDAGPYFEAGLYCPTYDPPPDCRVPLENLTIEVPSQTTAFSLQNFLPYGYAVAQVAVRGTGTSGGCMELMGPNEAADLSQAIDWLAAQPWSNGNVGMIGVSYDGSTPWMAAASGNPHLKTIVPVAGLPDIYGLMFHNGSAETRGAIMHHQVYWPFGYDHTGFPVEDKTVPVANVTVGGPLYGSANGRDDYQDRQNFLCRDPYEGAAMGRYSTTMGDRGGDVSEYWIERDWRDDVLANYKGSVFLIHGLQDWNVDPHAAVPLNVALRAAGIEVKEWYGQWGHALPDSTCGPKEQPPWIVLPCRFDFAEVLLRWYEHHLKDNTTLPLGPAVQVQDTRGHWRNADSYPPAVADWTAMYPTTELRLSDGPDSAERAVTLLPPGETEAATARGGPTHFLEFTSEPFTQDALVSGLPQLHVEFEAQGEGGYLGAWLLDENATGRVFSHWGFNPRLKPNGQWVPAGIPIVGHAQMDLRFFAGGETRQDLTPGQRYRALMEFEPLEVRIPQGHRLTLWLFQYGYPDHYESTMPAPVKVFLGGGEAGTVLRLPLVEIDPYDVFPVPGAHFPDPALYDRVHVRKPHLKKFVDPVEEGRLDACVSKLSLFLAMADCVGPRD